MASMLSRLLAMLNTVRSLFKTQRQLTLENLALRQQLAMLKPSVSMSSTYAGFFARTSAITIPAELTCHWTKIHPIPELLYRQSWEIVLHFPLSVDYIIVTHVLRHEEMSKKRLAMRHDYI